MKTKNVLLILLSILFIFNNCKKDENTIEEELPSTNATCNNSENIDTVFTTSHYEASTDTKDGGVIILEKQNNIYSLIKINSNGNFQWKKEFNQIIGNLTSITTTNNAIFITTNVDFNNISNYVTTGYEPNGFFYTDGIENCQPYYEFSDTFPCIYQNYVDGYTYLTKIDYNGNFIFSKQFEGNTIRNNFEKGLVCSLDNGDLALLTFDYYGNIPYEYNIDSTSYSSPHIDTVKYSINNNTVHLYHLNSNGGIIWEKTIENVQQHFFSLLEYYPLANYYVLTNSTRIIINLYSKILIYDYDGNLITTLNENNECDYIIEFSELLKDYLIFYQEKINYDEYTTITDLEGNIINNNFQTILGYNKPFIGNQFIYFNNNTMEVNVSDINNNIIKSKNIEYIDNMLKFCNIIPACDNSFYTIQEGYIDDGSATGGNNLYYVIKKEIFK